jgi:hypothetical protein
MYLNEAPSTAKFETYEKMENEKGEEEYRSGGIRKRWRRIKIKSN